MTTRRLGMIREDGTPRPLLIECETEERAYDIYTGLPGKNEGGINVSRYKSLKIQRIERERWEKYNKKKNNHFQK